MSYTLYAHRGNLFGPKPELENTPDYIDEAIKFGFKVEVDVWLKEDGNLYLGHDKPDNLVSFEYKISVYCSLEKQHSLMLMSNHLQILFY
jgi:glycerophosphoryl diester phosphodiesterase